MTPSQEKALDRLWPEYGIDYSTQPLAMDAIFGRRADRVLEIGFGNGETLVQDALDHPDLDYLGVEVHQPGVGHCLIGAQREAISNLRVISHDAIEVLQNQVPPESLAAINLYFPDPWPKKRHHKRRIVQPDFLALTASRLQSGGRLNIATDWENYAEHIDEVVAASPWFQVAERHVHSGDHAELQRQTTKFERRGLRHGHRIRDWSLQKT
jgi:tRNA (guanine-N7-)-methyltransferase